MLTGEFTKHLNGRIDLAQAEAIMDLGAKTEKGFNVALNQLKVSYQRDFKNKDELLKCWHT